MKIPRRISKRGRVEIIPMIDTILILLIFYMSFSTFSGKEKRLDARFPEHRPGLPSERTIPPPEIVLHVQSKGAISVNGVTYEPATLRDALATLGSVAPETIVIIEAEPETSYQAVLTAADVCAQAKLAHLTFRPVQS